jgi:glycopeptide antibiotics resistance protein
MFLPLGIVWPVAFKTLDSHRKVIAAGAGTSLLIEILQLPFFDRVSDVDDLILNTTGYLAGYGIYLLVRGISRLCKRRRGKK